MFVILEIHFSKKVSVRFFRMFLKLFSVIILGVRNFRVFEILEHLPYNSCTFVSVLAWVLPSSNSVQTHRLW